MSLGRSKYLFVVLASVVLSATSCNIQSLVPEGGYVLTQNRIETDEETPRGERISSSEINKYIKQRPAMDLFNIRSWFYLKADPQKKSIWNSLLLAVGTPPTILDTLQASRSADNIERYVASRGFFGATEEHTIEYDTEKRTAKVTYKTIQREPYRINRIDYRIEDNYIEMLLCRDSLSSLRNGDILDINALADERARITKRLRSEGYFDFSEKSIEFLVDTTLGAHKANVEMIIKQQTVGTTTANNSIYRIGTINVLPDYDASAAATDPTYFSSLDTLRYRGLDIVYSGKKPNIRPSVLRKLVGIQSGAMYNDTRVATTYENLMRVDYIHSANILFSPVGEKHKVTFVGDHWSDTAETTEGVLNCEIRLTPAMKQSYKVELEAATTSTFYGLATTVGYQNRNLFRGAEQLDLSFTLGYELLKVDDPSLNRNSIELGGMFGITFPQFVLPFRMNSLSGVYSPQTRVEFSINRQNRRYYDRVLSNVSFGYNWNNGAGSYFSLRPFDVSLVKMNYVNTTFLDRLQNPYLRDSYTTQMMAGISGTYSFGAQNVTNQSDYTTFRAGFSTSGNLLSGVKTLIGESKTNGHYTVFGIPYAQYVRGDVTWVRAVNLSEKTTFVYRLYGGLIFPYGNSKNESLPADRLFYSGGVNSMRGWTVRTLGPGGSAEVNSGYPSQFGNLRLEANVEFRFPLGGIFDGATFLDAGNVWYTPNIQGIPAGSAFKFDTFAEQIALNTGVGLRLNLKVLVLRLDWGIQLYNPGKAAGERWVIAHPDIHNTALNFGIGYPF